MPSRTGRLLPGFAAGLLAGIALAQDDFETPRTLSASEVLPDELRRGDLHQVDDAVRNDGYLNYYTIRSDYGDFEAAGTALLRIRVAEIRALAELDELSRTEVFIEAAADAGVGQLRTIKQFAARPIDTIVGIPAGIGRFLTRTTRQAGDGLRAARDLLSDDDAGSDDGTATERVGNAATSLAGSYFGVTTAERQWHRKLGTDPYTSNGVLREAVSSVAWADRLGRFGIRQAGIPRIPGVDVIDDVNDVVWSSDPYALRDLNRARLLDAGADDELIAAFFENPSLSPTLQTYLIAAIADLDGVAGRDGIVRQSLVTRSETEARFFAESVVLLAWYHRNQAAIESLGAELAIPTGVKADGGTAMLLAADLVYWTEATAAAASRHVSSRDASTVPHAHEIWLTGGVSDRARVELTALGWDIHENLTIMTVTDPQGSDE